MNMVRYFEAVRCWEWLQWRLSPAEWFEIQKRLSGPKPAPTDPVVAAKFDEITDPRTTNERRWDLLAELLTAVKRGRPEDP